MNEMTRKKIIARHEGIIKAVIERAKRDYPEDIALIGGSGSYFRGDYDELSDLDLVIVGNTIRARRIATGFILDGIGYDIYCTGWDRLEGMADFAQFAMVSHVFDTEILYAAAPEHLERFYALQERARRILESPVNEQSLKRARKDLDFARRAFADLLLADEEGRKRQRGAEVLFGVVNAIFDLNNDYLRGSVCTQMKEICALKNVPGDFAALYISLIKAKGAIEITEATTALLKNTITLYNCLCARILPASVPTADIILGSVEEFRSNYMGKIKRAIARNDAVTAYHAVVDAQNFCDEMEKDKGLPQLDLPALFDAEDISGLQTAFEAVEESYRSIYTELGIAAKEYASLKEFYDDYMKNTE